MGARMEWLREIFEDGVPGDAGRVLELCTVAKRSAEAGDGDLALNLLHAAALRSWWADPGPTARARVVTVLNDLPDLGDDPRYVAALALAEPFLEAAACPSTASWASPPRRSWMQTRSGSSGSRRTLSAIPSGLSTS